MTQEEQIQSAEALLACAKGEAPTLQWLDRNLGWNDFSMVSFRGTADSVSSGFPVRIKPEPKARDWTQGDVPLDAWYRYKETKGGLHRATYIGSDGVRVGQVFYSFAELRRDAEWTRDGHNFFPCEVRG